MKIKITLVAAFALVMSYSIMNTSHKMALEHDANSYYITAKKIFENNSYIQSFFSSTAQFIDHGYPTVLAVMMKFTGVNNIRTLQIANYVFWLGACYLIYKSLRILKVKSATGASVLMAFSPLYLTFSAKIYSEPFASLGTSLLIYSYVNMVNSPSLKSKVTLIIGGVILFSTKSVMLPALIPLAIFILVRKQFNYLWALLAIPLILLPSIVGAMGGGRSLYTLNIQSSKAEQRYDQIVACIPYYLSYPMGKALLPQYQGTCHQNDPSPDMPGYDSNPYIIADTKRLEGYTYKDWLLTLVKHPLKYLMAMVVSLSNIIFFEGIYPSILLQLPSIIMTIGFLLAKIGLSLYLWSRAFIVAKKNWLLFSPIIYFGLVVTHFPIEPRYFYPLIPYMYFLVGLSHNKSK